MYQELGLIVLYKGARELALGGRAHGSGVLGLVARSENCISSFRKIVKSTKSWVLLLISNSVSLRLDERIPRHFQKIPKDYGGTWLGAQCSVHDSSNFSGEGDVLVEDVVG